MKTKHAAIVSDPKVMLGKPVIAGTRITVELILEELASGARVEEILAKHPHLTRESVLAVFDYAHKCIAGQMRRPLRSPAEILASVDRFRAGLRMPPITDAMINEAKNAGRP